MSAQVSFPSVEHPEAPTPLALVPQVRSTVSVVGFILIVMALVAFGMGLVMVVTTSVAAQSKELSTLRTEVTRLDYRAASLTTELQRTASSASLAFRASDLGMVPNPFPAFIRLSDKTILGETITVRGDEVPYLQRLPKVPAVSPDAATSTVLGQRLPVAPGAEQ